MRLLRPARQETYEKVFVAVYTGLTTNVLLALACAPLLAALAIVRDPLASWPFFAVLSLVYGPALTGAFACFAALGEGSMWRLFWSAYRRSVRRALAVWTGGVLLVTLLVVDAVVVAGTAWGPALVPFFCTAAALVAAATFALLVAATEAREVRLRALVLPVAYLMVRRWPLTAFTLAVLGSAAAVVLLKPVIGLFVLCSPLLYAAWGTTRHVVTPIITREDARHIPHDTTDRSTP